MKIGSVGSKLIHACRQTDRQTDMTTLIVGFRNFAGVPSKPSLMEGEMYYDAVEEYNKLDYKEEVRETFAWREKSVSFLRPLVLVTGIGLKWK